MHGRLYLFTMGQILSPNTTHRVVLLLVAAVVCSVLYVSAMWRASAVSYAPSTVGDVQRAIELTVDRGTVGYTGG